MKTEFFSVYDFKFNKWIVSSDNYGGSDSSAYPELLSRGKARHRCALARDYFSYAEEPGSQDLDQIKVVKVRIKMVE
jgi:hypothetical protein